MRESSPFLRESLWEKNERNRRRGTRGHSGGHLRARSLGFSRFRVTRFTRKRADSGNEGSGDRNMGIRRERRIRRGKESENIESVGIRSRDCEIFILAIVEGTFDSKPSSVVFFKQIYAVVSKPGPPENNGV